MRKNFAVVLWCLVLLSLSPVRGQSPAKSVSTPPVPAFDAVSVKPSGGADPRGQLNFQLGGRFVMTNVPLRPLIMMAYGLPLTGFKGGLIIGAPDWVDSKLYNIEGRADGDPPREQMLLMLQSLLRDRFKLAARWETRNMPVYALRMIKAGKTGSRLVRHAADNSTCGPYLRPSSGGSDADRPMPPPCDGGLRSSAGHVAADVTMEELAKTLSFYQQVDRPVVDKTGLRGTFDLTLDYQPYAPSRVPVDVDPNAPDTIFEAVKEQLGLKLQPETGPVKVLVIDHIEEPVPN